MEHCLSLFVLFSLHCTTVLRRTGILQTRSTLSDILPATCTTDVLLSTQPWVSPIMEECRCRRYFYPSLNDSIIREVSKTRSSSPYWASTCMPTEFGSFAPFLSDTGIRTGTLIAGKPARLAGTVSTSAA